MNKRQLVGWPLIAFALLFAITNGWLTIRWLNSSSDPGWVEARSGDRIIVLRVRPELSQLLKVGDEVLQIDDKKVDGSFSIYQHFERVIPGHEYTLRVNRDGTIQNVRLITQQFTSLAKIGLSVTVVLVPIFYWIAGFLLFFLSQGDKRLILIAVALALTIPEVPLYSLQSVPMWAKIVMVTGRPLSFLVFPFYLNFVLIFPEHSPLLKKLPWLNHGINLYIPYIVLGFLGAIVISIVASVSPQEAFVLRTSLPGYLVRYGVVLTYIPAIFVALVYSLRSSTPLTNKKVTLLAIGFACGLSLLLMRAAFLFTLLFLPFETQSSVPFWFMEGLVLLTFSALALMPLMVTYAVARRRLIPLNVATRRAFHYLALYAFLVTPFLLAILVVNFMLFTVLAASMANVGVAVPLFLTGLVLVLEFFTFILFHQRIIRPALRRRAAKRGYDLRHALPDFGYQVRNVFKTAMLRISGRETFQDVIDRVRSELSNSTDIEDIANTVCKIIQETWVTDNAIMFLDEKNSGNYECAAAKFLAAYNLTRIEMAELILPKEGLVVSELASRRKRMLEAEDLKADRRSADFGLTAPERRVVNKLQPQLMLPIFIEEQMIGILSLGRPSDEFRYGGPLKQTLVDVASEAAHAIYLANLKSIAGFPDLTGLFTNVIRSAMTAVPAQKGSIYLWSERRQVLSMKAQVGLTQSLIGKIELRSGEGFAGLTFQSGKSVIIDDAQNDPRGKHMGGDQIQDIRSTICVPLITWSRVIGVLCLDNVERTNAFKQTHLDRVTSSASFAAGIVQNTRLQIELRDLALYLSPSNLNREKLDAAEVDGKKDSISLILSRTFQSIRRITEAKGANLVLLIDPYMPAQSIKQPLTIVSEGFEDNDGFSRALKLKPKGVGQEALKTRKAVVELKSFPESTIHVERSKCRACICLPLEISKYVGGLLYLYYHKPHQFTDAEKTFLSLCADQAALAISNVRRYDELVYTNKVVWMSLMMSNTVHDIRQSSESMRTLMDVIDGSPLDPGLNRIMTELKANLDNIRRLQQRSLPSASDNIKEAIEINKVLCGEMERWCDKEVLDCTNLESKRCFVFMDRKQLSLVLKNLTSNAVKAMERVTLRKITVTSKAIGKRIEVRITNTGKAIEPELQKLLFTDLISNSRITKGRPGMGLFIGRRILRFHDGDLNLVKSDDEGTTFSFWLPMVVAQTAELAREAFKNGNL